MEKEPTLFPAEDLADEQQQTQEPNPTQWEHLYNLIQKVNDLREETGIYKVTPLAELLPRTEAYYNIHIEEIKLAISGAAEDTLTAVINDYVQTLIGGLDYKATIQQRLEVLRICKPNRAFQIDRYGFYFILLNGYRRSIKIYEEYRRKMKGTDKVTSTKTDKDFYMNVVRGTYAAADCQALLNLKDLGIVEPSDFVGFDTSEIRDFLDYVQDWADIYEYTMYYTVAKSVLYATPQELDKIAQPPVFEHSQAKATDLAAAIWEETEKGLTRMAHKVADVIEAETQAQREKAEAEANAAYEQVTVLQSKTAQDQVIQERIQLHEVPNLIMSRPVNISPNGSDITNTLPIQRYIDDFSKKNPQYGLITPLTVQKVFEGINLLPYWFKGADVDNYGQFTYRFNISEFSQICGYGDANQEEKNALMGGILTLNNLYVIVNRPIKFVQTETAAGKTKRRRVGGQTAIRVISVREWGLETNDIVIDIAPSVMSGKPTLLTPSEYANIKKQAKGLTQSRFNAQLLSRNHKKEDDLTDEIFGLADMIKEAEQAAASGSEESKAELQKVKTYVRKHRSDFRKKVQKMFGEYQDKGILTYNRTQNNDKDFVYGWILKREIPVDDSEAEKVDDQ